MTLAQTVWHGGSGYMTGAFSCMNEDHVGFKCTPGSMLMSIVN